MTAPAAQTGRRIRHGLLWLGGGVIVVAMASAMVVIETRGRYADDTPEQVAGRPPAGDFDTYERANAARNEGRVEREDAAYDAYRASHNKPLVLRPLPAAPKR